MSGEIIKMSDPMTLIFEVMDLTQASPATVSRCGMIYLEPSQLGWEPIMKSWISELPEEINNADTIALFNWLVPPCLDFVVRYCKVGQKSWNIFYVNKNSIFSSIVKLIQKSINC